MICKKNEKDIVPPSVRNGDHTRSDGAKRGYAGVSGVKGAFVDYVIAVEFVETVTFVSTVDTIDFVDQQESFRGWGSRSLPLMLWIMLQMRGILEEKN